MKLKLINKNDEAFAKDFLDEFYKNQLIPAEKKSYLPNLEKSFGPFLGIKSNDGETHYILDAGSQIATLGLGYNPSAFNGVMQQQFSLTGDKKDLNLKKLNKSFHSLMKRILGYKELSLTYGNSGAEANEIALGDCFQKKNYKDANKILAFENSFHGRTMTALSHTWNPKKREPFEWQKYLGSFSKVPASLNNNFIRPIPEGWIKYWSESPLHDDSFPFDRSSLLLREEFDTLIDVKKKLATREYFAIIVEPMQCEGGERYLTNTFINALMMLAISFRVPLIMDEVQTGFHLGSTFFWHQQFDLRDHFGKRIYPDYIVCAKKAQVGIVISQNPIEFKNFPKRDEFCNSSLLRGYIQAQMLSEQTPEILNINKIVWEQLELLTKKYNSYINAPRANGLAFSFDLKNSDLLSTFVNERFNFGLLFYPAGNNTLRFRLTTAFTKEDILFLFSQLDAICSKVFHQEDSISIKEIERPYEKYEILRRWHDLIFEAKKSKIIWPKLLTKINQLLEQDFPALSFFEIDHEQFLIYQDKIQELQKENYEPTRQTDLSSFERASKEKDTFCFGLLDDCNELAAICFSAKLALFKNERGIRRDIDFENENSLYMLDTTVTKKNQGKMLGKILKLIHFLKASSLGKSTVSGRNRKTYARNMLNINMALGAIEEFYLPEDYIDDLEFRDALYYKYNTSFSEPTLDLSSKIYSFNNYDLQKVWPSLVNKICLSNFASKEFLLDIKTMSNRVVQELRHMFIASGQSEAVDKIVKSIWATSKKESNLICSFDNHYFGQGTFLSRSISNAKNMFYPVKHFTHPTTKNYQSLLIEIEQFLRTNKVLAFFIEPLPQYILNPVPESFLKLLIKVANQYNVPVVYNETASSQYRYTTKSEMLSADKILRPNASFNYLGGQTATIYLEKKYHFSDPLMMISTWDGDEYSMHAATKTYLEIKKNKDQYLIDLKQFDKKIKQLLSIIKAKDFYIQNAAGFIDGPLSYDLLKDITHYKDKSLILPSWNNIKKFLELDHYNIINK